MARIGGRVIDTSPLPNDVQYFTIPSISSVKVESRQYWAEVNWNVGIGTLTFQPTYRSFANDGTLLVKSGLGILNQPLSTSKNDFFTQELRLSSNSDSKLIWQVGAFYYDNILSNSSAAIVAPVTFYQDDVIRKKTTAIGLFAEGTYSLTDTLRVTAGLRYDDTKISVHEIYRAGPPLGGGTFELSGDAGKRDFSNVTYKLRVEHDLSPANLL